MVRTDRQALLRLYIPIMVVGLISVLLTTGFGVVVAMLLWSIDLTWQAVLFPLVLVVSAIGIWVYSGRLYLSRLRIDIACVIDRRGVRLAVQQTGGSVFLPWEVLAPVTGGRLAIRLRLRPGVGVDHPGIEGLDHPRIRRALLRTGLRLGYKGLTVDKATIAGAIWHFSGGRVTVD